MTDTITLATATLTRLTTAKPVLSRTPVASKAVPASPNEDWHGRMLITAIEPGSTSVTEARKAELIGTIQPVRSDLSHIPEAILTAGASPNYYVRVTGALLNPVMENGKHYLILDDDGEELWTVRYNDDAHVGDRNRPHAKLSVVSGRRGNPHYVDNDALSDDWTPPAWFEVEVETAGRPAVTGAAPDTVIREHVSGADDGPCWGLAEVDERGHVEVNPEPVDGKAYLFFPADSDDRTLRRYLALRVGGEWEWMGYYARDWHVHPDFTGSSTTIDISTRRWALAKTTSLVGEEPAEGRREALSRTFIEEMTKWDNLSQALVTMADDKDWCSEYEAFAEPLGLPARDRTRDWRVRGTADVTFTIESPSSYIDERIASSLDLSSLSITTMTITATVNFDISVSDTTEDGARDYVDSSEIEDWLSNNSGASDIDVSDYRITEVDED